MWSCLFSILMNPSHSVYFPSQIKRASEWLSCPVYWFGFSKYSRIKHRRSWVMCCTLCSWELQQAMNFKLVKKKHKLMVFGRRTSEGEIPFCVYFNKSGKHLLSGFHCQESDWTLSETKKLHWRKKLLHLLGLSRVGCRWKMLIIWHF